MDDRLRLIQYLYGETDDAGVLQHRLTEDDALRTEYEGLREMKNVLDRRSSPSPDSEVVDRVVALAGDAVDTNERSAPSPGEDRPPRRPTRAWTRRLRRASAAVAVVLLIGIGWWGIPNDMGAAVSADGTSDVVSERAEASQNDASSLPDWDERDEFVQIHRRLEQLQSQNQMGGWNARPQPVDRP